MKNIYLYGASDDLGELDSDFGVRAEVDPDDGVKINDLHFKYVFDGDWGVYLVDGIIPTTWKLYPIMGNMASELRKKQYAGMAIHIQIPDDEEVSVYQRVEIDEPRRVWEEI